MKKDKKNLIYILVIIFIFTFPALMVLSKELLSQPLLSVLKRDEVSNFHSKIQKLELEADELPIQNKIGQQTVNDPGNVPHSRIGGQTPRECTSGSYTNQDQVTKSRALKCAKYINVYYGSNDINQSRVREIREYLEQKGWQIEEDSFSLGSEGTVNLAESGNEMFGKRSVDESIYIKLFSKSTMWI